MLKRIFSKILVSIFILSLISCKISPTYSYKDVDKIIKKICKDEFNINVNVWLIGDSVWIYAPFKSLIDTEGKWDEATSEDIRRIFLSLSRAFLSLDKLPKFYAFVVSDTTVGADLYTIGFVPDMIKFQMGLISLTEREERIASLFFENPVAIGDKEGVHIVKYEITDGEFISYLVKQNMERKFTDPEFSESFKVNNLQAYYIDRKLQIIFDIMIKKYKEGLPDPFEEAKQAIMKFLEIYDSNDDIVEIEIRDIFNKKNVFYTKRALLE